MYVSVLSWCDRQIPKLVSHQLASYTMTPPSYFMQPIHFHLCDSVEGSIVSKNTIRESNQRCIVVHGTHNVTVSKNVAFNTKGHVSIFHVVDLNIVSSVSFNLHFTHYFLVITRPYSVT
jgi:parallel beta-helix repeat protein